METLSWETLERHLAQGSPSILSMGGTKGVQLGSNPSISRIFVRLPVPPETSAPLNRLSELQVDVRIADGKPVLEVSSASPALIREFHRFAGLLTEDFEKPGCSAVEAFNSAVDRWQEFAARKQVLTSEQQVGLCGELVFLEALIGSIGGTAAVSAWTARTLQFAERHDFRTRNLDLEIKTTRGAIRQHIIHGLKQLEASPRSDLYVVSLRLEGAGAGTGTTLSDRVGSIRNRLANAHEALASFNERLKAAKYRDADTESYSEKLRLADAPVLVKVENSFPRIVPRTLAETMPKSVAARVLHVEYRIDMEGLGVAQGTEEFSAVLGDLTMR